MEGIQGGVRELLLCLGEDPDREGLRDTPKARRGAALNARRRGFLPWGMGRGQAAETRGRHAPRRARRVPVTARAVRATAPLHGGTGRAASACIACRAGAPHERKWRGAASATQRTSARARAPLAPPGALADAARLAQPRVCASLQRVAKALLFALQGNSQSAATALGTALFTERALSAPHAALDSPTAAAAAAAAATASDGAALSGSEDSEDVFEVATNAGGGLVVVRHIELFSTSEADLQPFFGRCHVGYLPAAGRIVGLSKTARIAEVFARRLQTPQRLADEIAVRVRACHACAHSPALLISAARMLARLRAPLTVVSSVRAAGGSGGGCVAARRGCAARDVDARRRGSARGGPAAPAPPPAAHLRRHARLLCNRPRLVGRV
jgi:GTP cyclohydrolase I